VTRTATVASKPIELSARELAVLEILLQRLGSAVSKERLTDLLSSWDSEVTYNAIGITVHRLRKKIEPYGLSIKALRGLGYQLVQKNNLHN
jgi:DNA-binding response OmpR family regulator